MRAKTPDCYGNYDQSNPKCKGCWAGEGCIQLTVLEKYGKMHLA